MNRMLRVTSTVLVAVATTPFPIHQVSANPELKQLNVSGSSIPRPRASLRNHRNARHVRQTTSNTIYAFANRRIVKISETGTSMLRQRSAPVIKRAPKRPKRTHSTTHHTATSASSRSVSFSALTKAASSKGLAIAKLALGEVGRPYRWGGDTPSGFDCSGLIVYVYERLGIRLPRTSYAQFTVGRPVSARELRPGDLVFFSTDARGASHVAIYVGNGLIVQALNSQTGVIVSHLSDTYYRTHYIGARQPF